MSSFDTVIIGSGINSLTAAAILAKKGQRVAVLERNDWIGGCIKTDEITLPGFRHDVFSGWHPLFVTGPAYAELKNDLERYGLEYVNTDIPIGVVTPNNQSAVLYNNRQKNIENLNRIAAGDGDRYDELMNNFLANSDMVFKLLSYEPVSWPVAQSVIKTLRRKGVKEFTRDVGFMMKSAEKLLDQHFQSDLIKSLFAPWILHTGLGPNDTAGSIMMQLLIFSLEAAGMPVPKGGGNQLVNALVSIVENNGGTFFTNENATRILVDDGKIKGVQTESRKYLSKYVLANVNPHQLYQKLLPDTVVPEKLINDLKNYRYGNAGMQIHYALDAPLKWDNPELNKVAMINLSSGVAGVSRAVNEALNGLLPKEPTIAVGQHSALDSERAPEGKQTLWIQLLEMPRILKGDSLGEIDVSNGYTKEVIEAYVSRIEDRIAEHAPNFKDVILKRKIISPVELEAYNPNLVGGDPYSGAASLDQFLLWRPTSEYKGHNTPVKNLYQIGASTHPGPGLGGTSGFLAAKAL